jgi:uncharacterized membrane protein
MGSSDVVWRALGLGGIAGLRSMAAPAILSRSVAEGRVGGLEDTPFAALGSPGVSTALQALAVAEMIGDKTPFIPSRTSPPVLLGRAASGALVGAASFASEKRRPATGGALGVVSALTAAYAGERFRTEGAQRLGLPNFFAGLLEDGLVLLGGRLLLRGEEV